MIAAAATTPTTIVRPPRGATLIEMIVVVALLSVLAALAAPNLFPLTQKTRLAGEAEAVASFLYAVRTRAVADGRCYRVTLAGNGGLLAEKRDSGDCVNLARDGWAPSPLVLIPDGGITYRLGPADALTTSVAGDALVFRPSGRLHGDGDLDASDDRARVVVESPNIDDVRSVVVTGLGRICVIAHQLLAPPMAPSNAGNDCNRSIP